MKQKMLFTGILGLIIASFVFASSPKEGLNFNLLLENIEALADGEGCVNKPGQNNGTCVTNGKGEYFCANVVNNVYDCVK